MTSDDATTTPALAAGGRISLRTLIAIRWIAVAGQLATVLLVHYGLGYRLPIWPALAVIGVSVLLNLAAMIQGRVRIRLGERDAALYLSYDLLQLSVLLYLTGGLQNPFVLLLLAPLTVSAIILSRGATIAMTAITLASLTVLAIWHYPLPGSRLLAVAEPLEPSPVYELGVWFALSLSAVFVTAYVWQVADEARRIGEALAASQTALAREQRLSAGGALAAGGWLLGQRISERGPRAIELWFVAIPTEIAAPVLIAAGGAFGLLVFETLTYLGVRRMRFANAPGAGAR